jgi:hypothetical protein
VRLVKIPVLLRLARAMQRSEARDWLAVAALAQTSVVTSKPANRGQLKTGQRIEPETALFYLFAS